MNRRIFTAALSALLLTGVSAFAQSSTWTIDTNHSQVNFAITHMGVSTVRGSISGVTGTIVWDEKNPSKSSVEATIDATTVSTNNENRDKDLKSPDFFNVEKFPTMTFKSTSVSARRRQAAGCRRSDAGGRDQERNAGCGRPDGSAEGKGRQAGHRLVGDRELKRSDFNFGSKYGGHAGR